MAHAYPTALTCRWFDPLREDNAEYFDVCQEKLGIGAECAAGLCPFDMEIAFLS